MQQYCNKQKSDDCHISVISGAVPCFVPIPDVSLQFIIEIKSKETAIMKKLILLFIPSLLSIATIYAQDFVEVSTGAGYQNQAYFRLSDNQVNQLANESWDLAFSVTGQFNVGVAINESTTSITGAPAAELLVFQTSLTDFSATMDSTHLGDRVLNDESSWSEGGALSNIANPSDPFDFGWGSYNPVTHTLYGTRIFAVQLRDGSWLKFMIESFAGSAFTLKYANWDGSEEKTVVIDRGDYPDNILVQFSFSSGAVLDPVGSWDLLFGRYLTKLDDGEGNILDYPVTGVLANGTTELVKLQGVDPESVSYTEYLDSFDTRLDIIGHDWKSFSFTEGWIIPQDLVYFAKTANGEVYKLQLIDFEGSSTGISTLQKTSLGMLSSTRNKVSSYKEASLYPNPVREFATLVFSAQSSGKEIPMVVRDLNGKTYWESKIDVQKGLNAIEISANQLPNGMYFISVGVPGDHFTLKFMKH